MRRLNVSVLVVVSTAAVVALAISAQATTPGQSGQISVHRPCRQAHAAVRHPPRRDRARTADAPAWAEQAGSVVARRQKDRS